MEAGNLAADPVAVRSQTDSFQNICDGVGTENPFVGLRPFNSSEAVLFFGRREQVIELLQQLHHGSFLAVVGSSGCGKSSLVHAGLIPKLKAGFLVEERDRWRIASMRPGDSPLRNLAAALLDATSTVASKAEIDAFVDEIRTSGVQVIIERIRTALIAEEASLLLLVDQFEEIFRFSVYTEKLERKDEAADFVSIMLDLAADDDLPVFVVITMRSDFLGDCDNFYGLPEAMNRAQYLVPRPTRQQRQQAIEGPIRLFGARLTSRLLDRLLNDIGDQTDQLPVLQHALMRTWEEWRRSRDSELDLRHYEAIGTIKDALSRDAENAIAGFSADELKVTADLFQALTSRDERGRRIRRPVHQREVEEISGASADRVRAVTEHFCTGGRSFLNLDTGAADPLIDISHESLIRQWERLRKWVDEEVESAETYRQIVDVALRHDQGRAGLLRNPELRIALDWRARWKPNQAWAKRYHPAFETAMSFLDKSWRRRRLTLTLWAMLVLALISAVVVGYVILQRQTQTRRLVEVKREEQEKTRDAIEATLDGLYREGNNQFDDAIQKFNEAIEKLPNYAPAYFHRGVARIRVGQNSLAEADFEKVLALPVDEKMRSETQRFLRGLQAPQAPPPDDPVSDNRRNQLIEKMFDDDRATRIAATTALILGWKHDAKCIPPAVAAAQAHITNASGVINTLVLFESMDSKTLSEHRSEIDALLDSLARANPGPQTAEHIRNVRELLRGVVVPPTQSSTG